MKKILAAALVLGLVIPTASYAASNANAKPKKPVVKTAPAQEGTAMHETSEANSGTGEEGTKKVAKAKKSVIKKKSAPKAKK